MNKGMNAKAINPDVAVFVAAVRDRLVDLTEEEREELVGGLEGDMSDLVSERGVESLPEPAAYAAELRVAAGFAAEAGAKGHRTMSAWARVERVLDASAERWDLFARGLPGSPWELLVSLRPVWWVLRAWIALQLVDLLWGSGSINYGLSPIPSLMGWGLPLLGVAVIGSVLIGLGKLWPGPGRSGLGGRLVLLALNVLAIGLLWVTLGSVYTPEKAAAWGGDMVSSQSLGAATDGLTFNGEPVANVYPYDAQGRPLTGVQLVDRQGRRLSITRNPYGEGTGWGEFALVPWRNGRTPLFNVFPLPERRADPGTGDPIGDARMQTPPYASLPPVTLAGVTPSILQRAAATTTSNVEKPAHKKRTAGR
jgi:hypothetical protein